MGKDTKYDLTQEEYNRSLAMAEISTFMNAYGVKNPKSFFIVGQPGAGKTALKAYINKLMQAKREIINPIEFNPDEISIHHKYYREIMKEYPDDSYRILQRFTQPALDNYLRQRAVEIRCDIIQEGTFASTQGYMDIIKFQRNGGKAEIGKLNENGKRGIKDIKGGYNVRIYCLAVNRFESLLSCIEREQLFIENGLEPRVVTIENHDRAYNNILNTLDLLEQQKLFDELKVYRRGTKEEEPELILDYNEKDRRYSRISEYIINERNNQEKELFNNSKNYLERINRLKERAKKNQEHKSILDRIERVEQLFKNELEKNNKMNEEH